jgi:hypothetical protein
MTEQSLPERSILFQAPGISSVADRAAYLERACGDNRQLIALGLRLAKPTAHTRLPRCNLPLRSPSAEQFTAFFKMNSDFVSTFRARLRV